MRTSSKRVTSILMSAVFVLASLAVYAVLVKPEYGEVEKLRSEAEARARLLSRQREIVEQIQKLLAEYQSVSRLESVISAALPKEAAASFALAQFQGIAKASGVGIQSISVQPMAIRPPAVKISSAKGTGVLRFSFKLFGGYEQFKKFAEAVESNIRVMDIKSLKAETGGVKNDSLIYNMVVDVYYLAP